MFKRVCIANRGEIAVRVARTCRRLGIASHALYSEADTNALHVRVADGATLLGAPPVAESYRNAEKVIAAAKAAGCDALHPGYGLLSENAEFARACEEAGIVFVGPAPAHIELMGEKHRAREAMQERGMPVIPGTEGVLPLGGEAELAAQVGFPLIIKASRGGGGIGMSVVEDPAGLEKALRRARSVAERTFGSDHLYFERQLQGAHHVEFQVLGDGRGEVAVIGDRECSVQRRHQKVVEEAPAPALDQSTRERLTAQISEALRDLRYRNAGTVECLLDEHGDVYFLEMNTRLQVEHPVTEMVTGLDLVEWQLRLAAGEGLEGLQVPDPHGAAIEARLYAEDPERLLPSPGPVEEIRFPEMEGVRVDSGVESGDAVTPFYDPMVAKLIAWAEDRPAAVALLGRAIDATTARGFKHNLPFVQRVLATPEFQSGRYTVSLVPDLLASG